MIRALLLVGCAGCLPKPLGPFVHDFRVEGNTLVVDRCFVDQGRELKLSNCTTETRYIASPGPQVQQSLGPDQVAAGITNEIRAAVTRCGATNQVGGRVLLTIQIGPDGQASSVIPDPDANGFGDCVRQVFAIARFERSQQGARFTIPFLLPPAATAPGSPDLP